MTFELDRLSMLARVPGASTLAWVESELAREGLTLGITGPASEETVAAWLARGAPGGASSFADPADHLVAGLRATLTNGSIIEVRPSPRRAVGPDLIALCIGANGRFASIDHAWLRVHVTGAMRVAFPTASLDLDPPLESGEATLLDAISRALAR